MTIEILIDKSMKPFIFNDVENTYERGSFFCVACIDDPEIYRFPVANILYIKQTNDDTKCHNDDAQHHNDIQYREEKENVKKQNVARQNTERKEDDRS